MENKIKNNKIVEIAEAWARLNVLRANEISEDVIEVMDALAGTYEKKIEELAGEAVAGDIYWSIDCIENEEEVNQFVRELKKDLRFGWY